MNPEPRVSPRDLVFGRLVLIYQMPKIGSQTIESSLNAANLPGRVLRFHYLSRAFAKTLRHGLSSPQPDASWRANARIQLASIRYLSRWLRCRRVLCGFGLAIPKLQVITAVRDLIGLVLASIFENFNYFAPDPGGLTAERCAEALLHPKTFKTLRNWFDLELKPFTGIDVFAEKFTPAQGYAAYQNRFARVLVYRFEALNDLAGPLSQFLDWPVPALLNRNLGESKEYASQYRAVRQQLRLPPEFVASIYDAKMMRHFYSDHERREFHLKWTAPGQ